MPNPRYSEDELWENFLSFHKQSSGIFYSLAKGNRYDIVAVNEHNRTYTIQYGETGRTIDVLFWKVYAMYEELYRIQRMPRDYMKHHPEIVNQSVWRQPGATMYAILPHLDDHIRADEKGNLSVAM